MSFYGNLTNTARTQFQFDRIFPNRYMMERNVAVDGVYINRFVLVEYDESITEDNLKIAYYYNGKFYTTIDCTQEYVFNIYAITTQTVTASNVKNFYIEINGLHYPATGYDRENTYYELVSGDASNGIEKFEIIQTKSLDGALTGKHYQCNGQSGNIALFKELTRDNSTDVSNNYVLNYNIDTTYFGLRAAEGSYSRAWDSTVWQKVYSHGKVQYKMIAELNSNAPGFSILYDAPTQTPLAPHVDGSSGNNTYRVHLQPPWGFRIKEAEDEEFSDLKVEHITSVYDSKTDQINSTSELVDGAIYFNKKGFDVNKSVHDTTHSNFLTIAPTGKSGLKYMNHTGYQVTEDTIYQGNKDYFIYDETNQQYYPLNVSQLINQPIDMSEELVYEFGMQPTNDINELELSFPVLGNAVADFYDLMYGYNEQNENTRYRNTNWRYIDEITEWENGGYSKNTSTLAGSINHIHELTGEIIKRINSYPSESEIQSLSTDVIYYLQKDPNDSTSRDKYFYKWQTYDLDDNVQYDYISVDQSTEPYHSNYYFTSITDPNISPDNLEKDLNADSYDNSKTYYKRKIRDFIYNSVGTLLDYNPYQFYYKVEKNYYLDTNDILSKERDYYEIDESFRYRTTNDNTEICDTHRVFVRLEDVANATYRNYFSQARHGIIEAGWHPVEETTFIAGKTYYEVNRFGRIVLYENVIEDVEIPSDKIIVEKQGHWVGQTIDDIEFGATAHSADPLLPNLGPFIIENDIIFKKTFVNNRYYYLAPNPDNGTQLIYQVETAYPYVEDREYYEEISEWGGNNYLQILPTTMKFYRPNIFFYREDDDGTLTEEQFDSDGNNLPQRDNLNLPTYGRYYWEVILGEARSVWDPGTNSIITYTPIIGKRRVNTIGSNILSLTQTYRTDTGVVDQYGNPVTETPISRYYYRDSTSTEQKYYQLTELTSDEIFEDTHNRFYQLNIDSNTPTYSNLDFYVANKYYYFNSNEDLLIDTNSYTTWDRAYFNLSVDEETQILDCMTNRLLYVPEYYYFFSDNRYILDTEENATLNREYFKKDIYRIIKDALGYYKKGAPWNSRLEYVPCTIDLGIPIEHYELKDIGDITSLFHSLNGLILKYNRLLDSGDKLTRDSSFLQGVVNAYEDINNKVETELEPNTVLGVDLYGRVISTNISLDQLSNLNATLQSITNRLDALES